MLVTAVLLHNEPYDDSFLSASGRYSDVPEAKASLKGDEFVGNAEPVFTPCQVNCGNTHGGPNDRRENFR